MKNAKRNIISIFFTAMLLFSPLASFATGVYALLPSYNGESDTIYYFSDYYPTIRKETMEAEYPDHNIIYDHQWVNEVTFSALVTSEYFIGLDSSCILFIDIKTFAPNANVLYTLFSGIKTYSDCKVIFVTPYAVTQFSNSITNYIDGYFTTDFSLLGAFLDNTICDIYSGQKLLNNTILIDGRLVDIGDEPPYDLDDLSADSPFLRILLERILYYLEYDPLEYVTPPYDSLTSYDIEDILDVYGINLVVHTGNNNYVNILDWETYQCDEFSDFPNDEYTIEWDTICAIGFWQLEYEFYNFLLDGQQSTDISVYVLVVDPLIIGEDGLTVITDGMLKSWYGEPYHEEDALLDLLNMII